MLKRVLSPFALLCLVLFAACSASRPTAHVIVNNDSDRDIPLSLSISDEDGTQRILSNNIKPGLQELAPERLPKGMYSVCANTNNGLVTTRKRVSLDADRWIIINFMHADSMNIQRKYGYVDTSLLKKINGKYTGIDMYAENRRPPTL
ncbi:MAG: hypothetical protein ABI581_07090 [Sediminibacterium sp.]